MKQLNKILIAGLFFSTALFAKGELSLVSAGAGDLDNMTIKAHKTITQADIIFTMDGKPGRYQELIKGKPIYKIGHGLFSKRLRKMMSKEKVEKLENELKKIVLENYEKGKKMVIIDNGDPTIYGPHIGFMEGFKELHPKIIPGMSSFNAANAALQKAVIGGSKNASGVTLTIGTDKNQLIPSLAKSGSTMVFFMDREFNDFIDYLTTLYPKETPIAIVINAGFEKEEKVIIATLSTIKSKVKGKLPFNHLVYVGNFLQ